MVVTTNKFAVLRSSSSLSLWAALSEKLQIIPQHFKGIDAGFQYLMVFLVGFLSPTLSFFSDKGLGFFAFITFFFITLRYFMRPVYIPRLKQDLSSLGSRIFLGFIIVTCLGIIHTLFQVGFTNQAMLLLIRAVILILFFGSWSYFYQQQNEPFSQALSAAFLVGCSVYLILLGLDIAKNYLIWFLNGSRSKDPYDIAFLTSRVLDQNRSLIMISALIFLLPFHLKRLKFSLRGFHFIIITLFILSIINVGHYGTIKHYIHHVDAESVQIGLILSWLVFMLASAFPRLMTHLVFSGLIIFICVSPWFFQMIIPFFEKTGISIGLSLHIRLEIWQQVSQQITGSWQTLLWGNGLNSSEYLANLNVYHAPYNKVVAHPHAHNALLQIWLDLGVFSILLVSIMFALLWRWCLSIKTEYIPSVLATISMAYLLCMVTFSIWYVRWMAALMFMALHLSLIPSQKQKASKA